MRRRWLRNVLLIPLSVAPAGCGGEDKEDPAPGRADTKLAGTEGKKSFRTDRRRGSVRVAITLEGDSLAAAGFGTGRISNDPKAVSYKKELEKRQDETIARIEEALGHPLDVAHRFTRNVNVISANVLPGEIGRIRGVQGVTSVSEEQLNRPSAAHPGASGN